jgi:hypothetical protein
MFLSETRQRKEVVEGLRWRLGLKHVISFHEEEKEGVALFSDESVNVEVLKIDCQCIDVYIRMCPNEIKWRCTLVYGEPKASQRYNMWELIRRMKPMTLDHGLWLETLMNVSSKVNIYIKEKEMKNKCMTLEKFYLTVICMILVSQVWLGHMTTSRRVPETFESDLTGWLLVLIG